MSEVTLEKMDEFTWRVPKQGLMRTEGLIFANETLMKGIRGDECVKQVMNVACLPGIVGPSIAMPDIHWGYGFPIGGVAAFDHKENKRQDAQSGNHRMCRGKWHEEAQGTAKAVEYGTLRRQCRLLCKSRLGSKDCTRHGY